MLKNIEKQFPVEKSMLLLLSQCPGGLTMNDLKGIIAQDKKYYGNW